MKKKFRKANALFEIDENEEWKEHWKGMPEFKHKDLTPYFSLIIHFRSKEDIKKFSKLIEQNITENSKSLWFPKQKITRVADKRYVDESEI
jgi:hypothetical protein